MAKRKTSAILLLSSLMLLSGCGGTTGSSSSTSTAGTETSQSSEISVKCVLTIEMDDGFTVTDAKGQPVAASYNKGSTVSLKASGPKGKEINATINGAPLEEVGEVYSFVIEGDTILKLTLTDCTHKDLKTVERVEPTEFKAGSLAYYYCPHCEESFLDGEGQNKIESESSTIAKGDPRYIAPIQGEFCLLNSNVAAYLNASTEAEQISALRSVTPYNDQATKTLKWEGGDQRPILRRFERG